MEAFVQIVWQLPPFWPRLALLIAIILLLALPQSQHLVNRSGQRLARAKLLLELRKLELEVAKLRVDHPEVGRADLDAEIDAILRDPTEEVHEVPSLAWTDRLKLAAYGAVGFVAFGVLASLVSGRRTTADLGMATLLDLMVIVPCALIASAIPARRRWVPVFYGFLIPALVIALAVTAGMHD